MPPPPGLPNLFRVALVTLLRSGRRSPLQVSRVSFSVSSIHCRLRTHVAVNLHLRLSFFAIERDLTSV